MSVILRKRYECPNCTSELEVEVCDSVNADVTPRLRELVLNGEINSTVCSTCGKRIVINQPFLYHDMTRNFYIYYIPEHVNPDKAIGSAELIAQFGSTTLRYVPSLEELIDKIHVFEDGLNDIVVQVLKSHLLVNPSLCSPDPPMNIYYMSMNKESSSDDVMLQFLIRYDNGTNQTVGIAYKDNYLSVYDQCKQFNILCSDNNKCIYVDNQFIVDKLSM